MPKRCSPSRGLFEWLWRTRWAAAEYAQFNSDEEWREALHAALRPIKNHWAFWLAGLFGGPALLTLGAYTAYRVAAHFPPLQPYSDLLEVALAVSYLTAGWALVLGVSRPAVRHRLRQAAWQHGRRICLACGYNLRGQLEPRCPECGLSFAEGVRRRPVRGLAARGASWACAHVLARDMYRAQAGREGWVAAIAAAVRDALNHWSTWLPIGLGLPLVCSGGTAPLALLLSEFMHIMAAAWAAMLIALLISLGATAALLVVRIRHALRVRLASANADAIAR